jgi:erythromycin esterase
VKADTLLALGIVLTALAGACAGDSARSQRVIGTRATSSVATDSLPETTAPAEAVAWLKANAIPFDTSQAGSGFADLQPLKKVIGDARIVALGEATHGTREFFEMKHRLLEFLVVEMGFNTFAMEANGPEARLINDYVMTGQGSRGEVLENLIIWPWKTEEVLDMIEWMRAYNADPAHKRKVSFHGFDMQGPARAIRDVLDYLDRVDSNEHPDAAARYSCFTMPLAEYPGYASRPLSDRSRCRGSLQAVYGTLESRRADYTARTSAADFATALQSARMLLQAEEMYGLGIGGASARDKFMAENAGWLLSQAGSGAKIVLWAHNGHVSTAALQMGYYLRHTYGDDMVVFGFDFYEGSFRAFDLGPDGRLSGRGLVEHTVGPPQRDTYEAFFATAGRERMIVDLRPLQADEMGKSAKDWFARERRMRWVGATFAPGLPDRHLLPVVLPSYFDAIIFFRTTTASVPARP